MAKEYLEEFKLFGTPVLMVNDLMPNHNLDRTMKINWETKENIYRDADLISLHLPLTGLTKNLITKKELLMMKKDALIINTSRGGIINENDLYEVLKKDHLGGVAIDVFENEPYDGPLKNIDRCLLTAHMGSMSDDCRIRMEIEATEDVIRFFTNNTLIGAVPESEYVIS